MIESYIEPSLPSEFCYSNSEDCKDNTFFLLINAIMSKELTIQITKEFDDKLKHLTKEENNTISVALDNLCDKINKKRILFFDLKGRKLVPNNCIIRYYVINGTLSVILFYDKKDNILQLIDVSKNVKEDIKTIGKQYERYETSRYQRSQRSFF